MRIKFGCHNRKGRGRNANREFSGGKKQYKKNETMLFKKLDPQKTDHEK